MIFYKLEKLKGGNIMPIKFTKNATLDQILRHPEGKRILTKYRLPCLHCPMAAYEMGRLKIGEVAKIYGINIENLLAELNCTKS